MGLAQQAPLRAPLAHMGSVVNPNGAHMSSAIVSSAIVEAAP